ncbi:MAG: response regulator, partial [Desulfovibrionaceae bacterium]|nr:response regulator [Desulfovibrionaceae bacterium]
MKRLLVVDDEYSHRMMIQAVMQDEGWVVDEAENGEQALEYLEETRPSVVLL